MNWISLITKSPAHAYYHWNCPSNAIDNIDRQNVVRLSLRNRLQTRRNEAVVDVVDQISTPIGVWIQNSNQATFADLFSDAPNPAA